MKTIFAFFVTSAMMLSSAYSLTLKSLPGPKYPDNTFASISKLFFNKQEILIAKGAYAIFLSSNNGQNWSSTSPFGITGERIYEVALDTNGYLLAATERGVFRRESDWKDLNNLLPNGSVYTVAVSQTGTIYIVFKNTDIYYSKDNGKSWTLKNSGTTHDNFSFNPVLRTGFDGNMYLSADGKSFVTNDESTKWTQVTSFPYIPNYGIQDSIVYANTSSGFYISKNRGKTFTKQNSTNYYDIVVDRKGSLYTYDSDNKYMLVSKNQGKSWEIVYTSNELREIAFDTSGFLFSTVYTQGSTSGVWRSVLPFVKTEPEQYRESSVSISQNPANAFTSINYTLGRSSFVTSSLIDIQGRVVKQGMRSWMDAGSHELPLDVSDLPNGIYTVLLRTDDELRTTKLAVNR